MGHSRRPKRKPETSSLLLLPILQARAEERGVERGHVFGIWQHAKKKFGKGAIQALCEMCGLQVVAMPNGHAESTLKLTHDNPGLLGEALLKPCVRLQPVEPPAGGMGLR